MPATQPSKEDHIASHNSRHRRLGSARDLSLPEGSLSPSGQSRPLLASGGTSGVRSGGRYLGIYLNDHLAGATVGVELARRLQASNEGDEALAPTLRRLSSEIEADRRALEGVLDGLGVPRSRVKPIGAWLLERFGRLKPNGHLRSYSPLSRVLELEGLGMGVVGKLELWRSLAALGLAEPAGADFEALIDRAERQRAAISGLHQLAVAAM